MWRHWSTRGDLSNVWLPDPLVCQWSVYQRLNTWVCRPWYRSPEVYRVYLFPPDGQWKGTCIVIFLTFLTQLCLKFFKLPLWIPPPPASPQHPSTTSTLSTIPCQCWMHSCPCFSILTVLYLYVVWLPYKSLLIGKSWGAVLANRHWLVDWPLCMSSILCFQQPPKHLQYFFTTTPTEQWTKDGGIQSAQGGNCWRKCQQIIGLINK